MYTLSFVLWSARVTRPGFPTLESALTYYVGIGRSLPVNAPEVIPQDTGPEGGNPWIPVHSDE